MSNLTAVVEAEITVLRVNGNGVSVKRVVTLDSKQIESFESTVSSTLTACSYTFKIRDMSWDIVDKLELFRPITEQALRIVFRFGWDKPVWRYNNVASITPWMNASIISVTPTFDGDAITLDILANSAQLEYILLKDKNIRKQWFPISTDIRALYVEIAEAFNIKLIWGASYLEIDFIPIKGTVPAKKENETGLDYMARLFGQVKLKPTIGGKPVYVKFSPFPTTSNTSNNLLNLTKSSTDTASYGVFEILPAGNKWKPVVVYEHRGQGSKLISYSPELNPWLARKANEDIDANAWTNDDSESPIAIKASSGSGYELVGATTVRATEEIAKALLISEKNALLNSAIKATAEIVGDPFLAFNEYVQVNLYHPTTGEAKSAAIFIVSGIRHTIANGMFLSSVDLQTQPQMFAHVGGTPVPLSISTTTTGIDYLKDLQSNLPDIFPLGSIGFPDFTANLPTLPSANELQENASKIVQANVQETIDNLPLGEPITPEYIASLGLGVPL